ncbi:Probable LRR receptor-like serine/threonine-protein kinase At3g47570 [Linum grandiflorum]
MKDNQISHFLSLVLSLLVISLQATADGNNLTDRLALLEFKNAVTNDPDGALASWNDSLHFCSWPGITCNTQQRVTSLSLSRRNLAGTLSPHIANFTFLQTINLVNNSFHGHIPPQIGNLHRLQTLNLTTNFFTGQIPPNLTRCLELRTIRIERNSIEGNIPVDIGSLSKLQLFRMGTNNLTGQIPASLGNLSQLVEFAFAYNNLVGEIPETVGKLSKMSIFVVGVNQLNGTIPLSLYNLSSLTKLTLIYNKLHGRIPEDIGFTLPNLMGYYISRNWMSGPIPPSFCNASQLYEINMNRNSFTGSIPTCFGSVSNFLYLNVAANNLGTGTAGDFDFITGLSNCSQLEEVGVSENNLGGPLPNSLGNLSAQLYQLYLGDNPIGGTIPEGLKNLVNLNKLDLINCFLTGSIPSYFGKLHNLQGLLLNRNQLSGHIPFSFGNLSQLNKLDLANNQLEGSIPLSLGSCQQLNLLDISANKLTGVIPREVFSLSSLSGGLYLSRNSFTGRLPNEIGSLENLQVLDLSYNNLTGKIPATIGDCKNLKTLYLQSNSFDGNIPSAIASIKGMQELDLSRNKFTGEIPSGLQSIQALQHLNLSFNDLQGKVPDKGVFANTSGFSLTGNTLLCGGVIELHLKQCPTAKTMKQKRAAIVKLTLEIVLPSLTLLLLSAVLYQWKLWRSRKKPVVGDTILSHFVMVSYKDLHQGTNGFSSDNLIGSGGFGTIYKAVLDQIGPALVAVKVLNIQENKAHKSLLAECNALKNVRHKNLVRVLTYCSSLDHKGNDFKALVFEFMSNGSLEDWLHSDRNLSLVQRINILVDVASALHYLHDLCETPVVHCDLKPSNVLLDADMVAHVGDFGLARILSSDSSSGNESSTIGIRGTIGYAPPEYGMGMSVWIEGDVYSYGILVLEMFTGKRPTNEMFKDGMNLRDFVKAAILDGITSVIDPSMSLSLSSTGGERRLEGNREADDNIEIVKSVSLNPPIQANASGNNHTDRLSLLEFKKLITNDPIGALASWNDSLHFCKWLGITCNTQQRVTSLSLSRRNLVGTLSPHIGNFTFLRNINLINNSFHGQVPPQIGNLRHLQTLNLTQNFLTGEIPTNLTRCLELRTILIERNSLEGNIPVDIGSLSKLQRFRIGTNNLTGRIPSSLGNLSLLVEFAVAYNNMVGGIPETVGKLSKISIFVVGVNQLNGTIPISLYNLSSLTKVTLIYNQFQGKIPEDIGLTLPNLMTYGISKNWMSGTIPQSFCNASQLYGINMNQNSLTGSIPTCLGRLSKLSSFHVGVNNLGTNSAGDFEFMRGLSNCSQLQDLGVSANNLGGPLPNYIGNLSVKLDHLLVGLNPIKGTIPDGLENLVNLIRVDLSYNLFTGPIPSYFGKLHNLQGLVLSGNQLSGTIPSSLGNLSILNRLDMTNNQLEGAIPFSLGDCQQLNLLDISANKLSGEIPKQVFSLSSLSGGLHLSSNFFSGALPDEIRSLANLEVLDLAYNNLTGEIPETIGDCKNLKTLYLQSNTFDGNIPSALASIKGMEELDLSQNKLTGEIPSGLQSIQALQRLNVSFNDLQGKVPDNGVFANTSGFSMTGNTLLCGGVMELHLKQCPTAKTMKQKRAATVKLTLEIVLPSLTLLLLSAVLYQWKLWRSRKKSVVGDTILSHFMMVSYKDLHQGTNGFSSDNLIGSGGFGNIYKAVLDQIGPASVAVKVLNIQENKAHKSLLAECNALKNVRHRNLVRVLTYCSSLDHKGNDFKALVFEFMSNGSLEDWLHSDRNLSLVQRINILVDVASALHYLHDLCETPVVHCDLKPSNILLDADMVAHVGDFGLARILSSDNSSGSSSGNESSTIGIRGTIGYAPPEYGMGMSVSVEGDVYSYGILILQMLTGKRPTHEMFKDGMNLRDFVKASIPDGITSVLDPSMSLSVTTAEDRRLVGYKEANEIVESGMSGSVKECLVSVVQIGLGCSTDGAGERMKTADIARKMVSVRDLFVAAASVRRRGPQRI